MWKPEVDICSSFLGVKQNVWPLPIWQPHYENLVTPKSTGIVVSFQETTKKDVATRWPSLKSIFNLLPEITDSYKNYILQWILVKLAKKKLLSERKLHASEPTWQSYWKMNIEKNITLPFYQNWSWMTQLTETDNVIIS